MRARHYPVRTILFQVPSRHRRAVDEFKRETGRTIRSIMLEGIDLVMHGHGQIENVDDLHGIIEFPERRQRQ